MIELEFSSVAEWTSLVASLRRTREWHYTDDLRQCRRCREPVDAGVLVWKDGHGQYLYHPDGACEMRPVKVHHSDGSGVFEDGGWFGPKDWRPETIADDIEKALRYKDEEAKLKAPYVEPALAPDAWWLRDDGDGVPPDALEETFADVDVAPDVDAPPVEVVPDASFEQGSLM